jgi:DNA polymerase-3 subunit gamma/tau
VAAGLDLINQMIDDGVDPRQLAREVVEYLRAVMLARLGDGTELLNLPDEIVAVVKTQAARADIQVVVRATTLFNEALVDIKSSLLAVPQLPLELAFVEATTDVTATPQIVETVVASPAPAVPAPKAVNATKPTPPPPPPPPLPEEIAAPVAGTSQVGASQTDVSKVDVSPGDASQIDVTVDTVRNCLERVVENLEQKNKVMAEALRNQVRLYKVSNNEIHFTTSDMMKKRFEKPQPKAAIDEAFSQAIGTKVMVRFMTESVAQGKSGREPGADEDAAELLKVAEELGGKIVK